ncbi:MAG: alpha/beta hydrolase [Planctomycetota bacterium]
MRLFCVLLVTVFSFIVLGSSARGQASSDAEALLTRLENSTVELAELARLPEAQSELTRAEAERLTVKSADRLEDGVRAALREQWDQRELKHEEWKMPFFFKTFGKKPADGWSLYISMHGGGGTTARANDQQWENQKRLYTPEEGIYCAPRAPTNTWNLWHQPHIDVLFDRLIQCMVAFEEVNWDRVYLMGYSAGGDGVYQLAPRMADRWAAASMMAGHPNGASPLNLRNVPFTLQVGGLDRAYQRNQVAEQWKVRLAELQKADPDGYDHFVRIYPNMGHWMQRRDAVAVGWMAEKTRRTTPSKLVWRVDGRSNSTFYWLANAENLKNKTLKAEINGQIIELSSEDVEAARVGVMLDDRLVDLDQAVTIRWNGKECFSGTVKRTAANLIESLLARRDPMLAFPGKVVVTRPQ